MFVQAQTGWMWGGVGWRGGRYFGVWIFVIKSTYLLALWSYLFCDEGFYFRLNIWGLITENLLLLIYKI